MRSRSRSECPPRPGPSCLSTRSRRQPQGLRAGHDVLLSLSSPYGVLGRFISHRHSSTTLNGICAGQRPYAHHGQRFSIMHTEFQLNTLPCRSLVPMIVRWTRLPSSCGRWRFEASAGLMPAAVGTPATPNAGQHGAADDVSCHANSSVTALVGVRGSFPGPASVRLDGSGWARPSGLSPIAVSPDQPPMTVPLGTYHLARGSHVGSCRALGPMTGAFGAPEQEVGVE